MRALFFVILAAICFLVQSAKCQTPANDPHWQLIWGDDFNGSSFNQSSWLIYANNDHYGEPAVMLNRPENIKVENGEAIITLRRESDPYSCGSQFLVYDWDCMRQRDTGKKYNFTTGGFQTQSKNFKYGYIEARIKVPYSYGNWPAFWTYQNGFSTSNEAEIDVFEMDKTKGATKMPTNIHLHYCCGALSNVACPNGEYPCPCVPCSERFGLDVSIPNYANVYRTYAVEWSPERITWFVDGNIYRTLINPGVHDAVQVIFGNGIYPSLETPAYGTYAGEFPSVMHIDYFKYYVPRFDCDQVINQCSYNLATHDNKVKKSITIGGSGCSNSVPSSSSVFLRAAEGVLIKGTFSVPVGATLYVDGSSCYEAPDLTSRMAMLDNVANDGSTLTIDNQLYLVSPVHYDTARDWVPGFNVILNAADAISETYDMQVTYPGANGNVSILAAEN